MFTIMKLPFQFIVIGTPVSYQSQNKKVLKAWKKEVLMAALSHKRKNSKLITEQIEIVVTYYHEGEAPTVSEFLSVFPFQLN